MALTRRDLFRTGGTVLAGLAVRPRVARATADPGLAAGGSFPTGVLAGDPRVRAIVLAARVDGLPDGARVGVEVARDPDFGRVVARRLVPVRREWADVARVRIASPAFRSGEPFWYRFFTRDADSPIGRFRMRPEPDSSEPVRMAWFSCQGWPAGYYGAHTALAQEPDLDLALSVGDYIYELTDDTGPPDRVDIDRARSRWLRTDARRVPGEVPSLPERSEAAGDARGAHVPRRLGQPRAGG